jgi:hypothetical protein
VNNKPFTQTTNLQLPTYKTYATKKNLNTYMFRHTYKHINTMEFIFILKQRKKMKTHLEKIELEA